MMDEKTLLQRANEERERLFQRYERGREPGAEIDPWEDPGFEVYHQTDRYGFIHDKRLPQKIDLNEMKLRSIEMERVKKWLKMLKNFNSKDTQDKLHKRIYKGIPDKLRSQVWMKLLNIEQIMSEKKDVYQNMLKLAKQWSTEARQIDSDVNRQFREHLFYRERYSIKQKSLFNVLTAYSMYNMEVGYCQGMSGVAGVLLMYMDEEEAFWALSTLLADKKYAMHGLYIEGFPKLNRLVQHHDRIIEKFLPKLKKHFDLHNLDSMIYSLKWFFVIFIERIPFSLCLRVWDIYLLDGERVVTAMAYTILKLHQKKLLKLKDMDLLVQYLQTKLHKDFGYDDDHVIKILEQSLDELRKTKLDYAPPPPDTEFPKRPFGVFIEPTVETKIGRRKSSFTDTEKEVTENVILRREKTQQELAESTISDGGLGGSSSQLNTGNIPESEDGGSLLGSSRKSLADTSITSTADLSVFSTGQRSQQFDIGVDDTRSMRSDADGEGESSPGSAFGSLSIVGRTPSAMMITPTPRAISPHDIVRIYVPPAPPDERSRSRASSNPSTTSSPSNKLISSSSSMTTAAAASAANNKMYTHSSVHNNNNKMMISNNSNLVEDNTAAITKIMTPTTSSNNFQNNFYENSNGDNSSKRNSIISGDITPVRRSLVYKSDDDLMVTNGCLQKAATTSSSSSSRRGSLSRKSPSSTVINSMNITDCEHIRNRRRSTSLDASDEQINSPIKSSATTSSAATIIDNDDDTDTTTRQSKVMTSFEQLARQRREQIQKHEYDLDRRTTHTHTTTISTTSEDEDFSPRSRRIHSKSKYDRNECSIQYRTLAQSPSSPIDTDFNDQCHYNQSSDDAMTIEITSKFNTNTTDNNNTNTTNINDNKRIYNRKRSDNSDNEYSSSSPNQSKSILTTPVNEQMPSSSILTSSITSVTKPPSLSSFAQQLSSSPSSEASSSSFIPIMSITSSQSAQKLINSGNSGETTPTTMTTAATATTATTTMTNIQTPTATITAEIKNTMTIIDDSNDENERKNLYRKNKSTNRYNASSSSNNDGGSRSPSKSSNPPPPPPTRSAKTIRHFGGVSGGYSYDGSYKIIDDQQQQQHYYNVGSSSSPPPPPSLSSFSSGIDNNRQILQLNKTYEEDNNISSSSMKKNIRPSINKQSQQHQQPHQQQKQHKIPIKIQSPTIRQTPSYTTGNNKLISSSNKISCSGNDNKINNSSNNSSYNINNRGNNIISSSHSSSSSSSNNHEYVSSSGCSSNNTIKNSQKIQQNYDDNDYDDDDDDEAEELKSSSSSVMMMVNESPKRIESIAVTSTRTTGSSSIDFDRRIAAPIGGSYEYKTYHSQQQQQQQQQQHQQHHSHHNLHHHHHHTASTKDMNKIRIKVQQKQ